MHMQNPQASRPLYLSSNLSLVLVSIGNGQPIHAVLLLPFQRCAFGLQHAVVVMEALITQSALLEWFHRNARVRYGMVNISCLTPNKHGCVCTLLLHMLPFMD